MLTVPELRVLVTTSISDDDLEEIIAREEAWLARRIGPLEGERVETFIVADGDEILRLTRPATEVVVEDGGGVVEVALRGWGDVVLDPLIPHSWQGAPGGVTVAYVPSDENEVKRSIVTLCRLTIAESAFASQSAGGYSVGIDLAAQRTMRWSAWRTLLRPAEPSTTQLRSAIAFGGKAVSAVATVATGS